MTTPLIFIRAHGALTATVPVDLLAPLCAGHFPGRPLVPGAWLLALMAEGAQAWSGAVPTGITRAAFRAPVTPDAPAECHMTEDRRGRLAGQVRVGETVAAQATFGALSPTPITLEPDAPSVSDADVQRALAGLAHAPPARVIQTVTSLNDTTAVAPLPQAEPWPRALDGAAQLAGLVMGVRQPEGPQGGVVAEFKSVALDIKGDLNGHIRVRFERRVMGLQRFGFDVIDAEDAVRISGQLTLAIGG